MSTDAHYMARALQLARRGEFTSHPNPNVGCVIVRDGQIVGEGCHYRAGQPHAEIHALRMAGDKARGATVYITLEPCSHYGRTPPCCEALIAAEIKRVVVAMVDPNPLVAGQGLQRLNQAGIASSHGLMAAEAEQLNPGFLKRMRSGLPLVQLKLAASLDGRTAMAGGESQWITSPQARQDVQRFRALSGAILTSSATVLADNPALTVRWQQLDPQSQAHYPEWQHLDQQNFNQQHTDLKPLRQPIRVVLDRQQQLTEQHRIIHQPGQTWLVRGNTLDKNNTVTDQQNYSATAPQLVNVWQRSNVQQLTVPLHNQQLDLAALLRTLGALQINSVWVEAGCRLAGALLQAQLVDELIIYLAPKLLGDNAMGLCTLPGLEQLASAPQFTFSQIRQLGPDLCLHLRPQPSSDKNRHLPTLHT